MLKKIAKLYPSYADVAFDRAKKHSAEKAIFYTVSQCTECPYEHECCNYVVGATPFEVIPIIEHIKTLPDSEVWFKKIKARAKLARKFFRKYPNMRDGAAPWSTLGKKCVFYDKEKKQCSIYNIRPMNCRSFFSIADCTKQQGSSINEEGNIVLDRFAYITSHTLDPKQPYELCTTITKMLKNPEIKISERFEKIIETFDQDK